MTLPVTYVEINSPDLDRSGHLPGLDADPPV